MNHTEAAILEDVVTVLKRVRKQRNFTSLTEWVTARVQAKVTIQRIEWCLRILIEEGRLVRDEDFLWSYVHER